MTVSQRPINATATPAGLNNIALQAIQADPGDIEAAASVILRQMMSSGLQAEINEKLLAISHDDPRRGPAAASRAQAEIQKITKNILQRIGVNVQRFYGQIIESGIASAPEAESVAEDPAPAPAPVSDPIAAPTPVAPGDAAPSEALLRDLAMEQATREHDAVTQEDPSVSSAPPAESSQRLEALYLSPKLQDSMKWALELIGGGMFGSATPNPDEIPEGVIGADPAMPEGYNELKALIDRLPDPATNSALGGFDEEAVIESLEKHNIKDSRMIAQLVFSEGTPA